MRTETSNTVRVAYQETKLSGLEQIYYAFDAVAPINPCTIIEVEGETTIDQWRAATAKIISRAPVLSCRIVRNPSGHLIFEPLPAMPLPFHVSSRDPNEWQCVTAEEMSTRIDLERGPLFRVTLLHSPSRATLLLTMSHCVVDGKSVLVFFRDILRALAGEPLGPPAVERSMDSLLIDATGGRWQPWSIPMPAVQRESPRPISENPLHLEAICFNEQITSELKVRARRERTTLHGALCAALTRVFCKDVSAHMFLTSAMDVRPILSSGQAGMRPVISSSTVKIVNENFLFWDFAKRAREFVRRSNSVEAIAALYSKIGEVCTACPTQELIPEKLTGKVDGPEIQLSNLGVLPIPLNYGDTGSIKLKGFWAAMHPGSPNGHFLFCSTVHGQLQMFYTACQPEHNMASKLRAELEEAVR